MGHKKFFIPAACFSLLFFYFSIYADAATLCSYQGPDLSPDYMRITNFIVSGPSQLKEGDTISVSFSLQNYGQYDYHLGTRGIFAAARDPDNVDASFGFSYAGNTMKAGQTLSVQASRTLGKPGTWKIWSSYSISSQGGDKFGPDEWHLCTLSVSAVQTDSDQDGIPDQTDNCLHVYNPNQLDVDQDGTGDACDQCDERDSDGDGVVNCVDKCPKEKETINKYQDEDGCPDQVLGQEKKSTPVRAISIRIPTPSGTQIRDINAPSSDHITGGPVMQDAIEDGDGDGVVNILDDCPGTRRGTAVFDNGCRCNDGDNGIQEYVRATVTVKAGLNGTEIRNYTDDCRNERELNEYYCDAIGNVMTSRVTCDGGCEDGACRIEMATVISYEMFTPAACATSSGSCSDSIQNQDETGIDCGGSCAPCNTRCLTGTKFAPPDTPCVSNYSAGFGGDPHRIELTWTNSDLEYVCQYYEICSRSLDYIINEAQDCCSRGGSEIASAADPELCKSALRESGRDCKKCRGLYIIKGLGTYARWMVGYHELTSLYTSPIPTAEKVINVYQTGVCRDYSLAVATLLRKAGYSQNEVFNFCDGDHCYNLVKFPGDAKYHVVDTTGNNIGVNLGALPGGYPYCNNLNESKWCFKVRTHTRRGDPSYYYTGPIADIDAYWATISAGRTYEYPMRPSEGAGRIGCLRYWDCNDVCTGEAGPCPSGISCLPQSGPGTTMSRDNFRIPDYAPTVSEVIGC